MAARTGASVGVAVTITILGVLSLALFVLSMVFYGNMSKAKNDLNALNQSLDVYVTQGQRSEEDVRRTAEAARDNRESVIRYLLRSQSETMQLVGGPEAADFSHDDLVQRVQDMGANENASLLGMIDDQRSQIAALEDRAAQAEADRDDAVARAQAETQRVADIEQSYIDQGSMLGDEVGQMRSDLSSLTVGYEDLSGKMRSTIDAITAENESTISQQRTTIRELQLQLATAKKRITELLGQGNQTIVMPLPEESLVDAQVQRIDPVAREVTISIGRRQKAVLGMTFAIYGSPTDIRPDRDTGEYARGKASVEIIRVAEDYSVARIVEESRGNPIVRGDVAANAVYDPSKTYKMMVFGNFDVDRDGVATPLEREDLKALIMRWGARVIDDMSGDIDYVILGEKPVLGPEPPPGAPVEVVEEYLRRKRVGQEYDSLLDTAQATGVPILNENRLRTLIGDYPR